MTALVTFFAVIGIANVAFMLIFVGLIWANERAAGRGRGEKAAQQLGGWR
jgi:hypothetical protein